MKSLDYENLELYGQRYKDHMIKYLKLREPIYS